MKAIPTLLAAASAAMALAVSTYAAEPHSAGITNTPDGTEPERYIPFVTDFPEQHPEASGPVLAADTSDGFDGLDAAFGAAVGVAVGALGAVSLPALRRRNTLSSA